MLKAGLIAFHRSSVHRRNWIIIWASVAQAWPKTHWFSALRVYPLLEVAVFPSACHLSKFSPEFICISPVCIKLYLKSIFGSFPVPPFENTEFYVLFYVLLRLNVQCYAVKYEEQICSELSICSPVSLQYDNVKYTFQNWIWRGKLEKSCISYHNSDWSGHCISILLISERIQDFFSFSLPDQLSTTPPPLVTNWAPPPVMTNWAISHQQKRQKDVSKGN